MKVTEYEGAKVPEGATHLSTSVPVGYFCKFIGKDAYFFFGQEWKKSNAYGVYIKDNLTELPEQPTKADEWDGKGDMTGKRLRFSGVYEEKWHPCIVKFSSKNSDVIVVREDGHESDTALFLPQRFMPLKTAEEKKREALELKLIELQPALMPNDCQKYFDIYIEDLIDAGCEFTALKGGD